jgi:hypothetical protein
MLPPTAMAMLPPLMALLLPHLPMAMQHRLNPQMGSNR